MSRLIRKSHYSLIALTFIAFSVWLVLKTDKSSSDSDVRNQGTGRHAVSQVSDYPSTTGSDKPSGTKNASKASVQAKEIVKTKTDDAHDRNQLVAATEELPVDVANKANIAKGPHARPAIRDPKALRRFGKGAPFVIGDLPDGKLKENLLALTPNHKVKALKWLHSFTFSGIDAIDSLRADNTGGIFYDCPDADLHGKACAHHSHTATASTESAITAEDIVEGASVPTAPVVAAAAVSIDSPPVYNSKPGAPNHIYLDFNGGAIPTTTAWGGPSAGWDVQVWSQDGDFTTFNDSEQAWMRRIYERIAEDYAPFNVNVTTDAATYDPDNTGGLNNVGWLLHCTGTDKNGENLPHVNSGGVAYVGVFGQSNFASTYQPAWVKSTNGGGNEATVAEAASHEMGHNMGLSHDTTNSGGGYYGGHGTGDTSWGPIMGTGYGRNVSQWSQGEYFDYFNTQTNVDDLAIISGRVSYRTDDHGDTTGTATAITPAGDGSVNKIGIIETTNDPDFFSFSTGAGSITLNASPYKCDADTNGGNLDIILELYQGSTFIASNDPASTTTATITTTVPAGNYHIKITPTGVGQPEDSTPTGYTDYGSLGQYTITGNVILPGISVIETGGITTVTEGGVTDTYSLSLGTAPTSSVTVTITPNSQVSVNKSSVTFTTFNWSTPQIVTLTAVDDSTEEGSHTGTISHAATSSDSAFNGVGVGSVIANITDNDNIVLTSPNGGESFFANTVQAITWDSLLPGNVKIELLKGGGSTTIVASTPNNGSYNWSIPQFQAPAIDYSIRITSVEAPSITDTGDGYFTIIEAPIYFTDLESDPGFTTTGDWEWGTPSGANAAASAHSGTKMYDAVLADTSWANQSTVLKSVAIDCTDYTAVQLEFYVHALLRNDSGTYPGSFTMLVEASNTGTDWGNTVGKSKILFSQTGMNTSWVKYNYNIADIADGASTVYVRWSMINNNTGSYQNTGGGMALDDVKLTGTYISPVSTYSVTYEGNGNTGGSVPTDSATYENLATVTVLGNTGSLTKDGFAFSGWDIQTNGNGVNYAPASTFAMGTSNVTLHAQWTALAPSYSVTYNGNGSNGGSVPIDASTYEDGVSVTVLGNTGNLTKDGFIFAGWNTQANEGGVSYAPAATFSMGSSEVTLYAKWTEVPTYTVIYNGNGSTSGSLPNQTKTQGVDLTLLTVGGLLKTGYTFVAWNTVPGGTGTPYAAGANYTVDAHITLYAQWTISTYTISYTGNGQTGGSAPSNQTKTYDTNITLSGGETLVRDGHAFDSWNTGVNGGGASYAAGVTYSTNAALDLYAQWIPDTYTVSYNGNGNTSGSAPSNQTKTHGVNLALRASEGSLIKTNQTFSGWNTAANGSGTPYAVSATYSADSDVTLYAQWLQTVVVLTEGFESPSYPIAYEEGVLPDNGNWVGADAIGGGNKGDQHGITDKAGGDFVDPDPENHQAYSFRNTDSGITTAETKIGALTADTTYTISFDVIPIALNGNKLGTDSKAQLIAFASGAARNDCRSTPAGSLVLEELAGSVTSTVTFEYTTGDIADGAYLGFDLGLRFVGSKTSAIIDNVQVTTSSISAPPVPGPVDHFAISAISSTQTVGTPITGITITAQDAANATATDFTGTVNFGGTGGFSGTSANFTAGVLTGVSVTPTVVGSDLTLTVDDGLSHTGSATLTVLSKFQSWAGGITPFSTDTNNDGVPDGLAWLLGANDPSANAQSLMPIVNSDGGRNLVMTFSCLNAANRGSAVVSVQYSQDLGVIDLWTNNTVVIPESSGTFDGVIFIITPNGNVNDVEASVPAGALGSSVFGRIFGGIPTP